LFEVWTDIQIAANFIEVHFKGFWKWWVARSLISILYVARERSLYYTRIFQTQGILERVYCWVSITLQGVLIIMVEWH